MNANELRIGNLVRYTGGFENKDLTYRITEAMEIHAISDNTLYEPIPLTPEIWKTLSNDEGILDVDSNSGDIQIRTNKEGLIFFVYEWTIEIIEIKYVHQLQNLYFALTGEELEINIGG